jgi:hypothetical protein
MAGTHLRRDTILLRHVLTRIHIHLAELQFPWFRLLLGQATVVRCDGFAGTAPVGVEVDDGVCGLGDDAREVRCVVYGDDLAGHCCGFLRSSRKMRRYTFGEVQGNFYLSSW